MGAQMLLIAGAQLVMIGLVNREGLDTTAAYGASMQLWNYLQMPAFAIGSAVSAMVAQSIGASNHSRAGAVTLYGVFTNLVMTGVLGALTGVIGAMMAMEVLRLVAGFGEPQAGRLALYDALGGRMRTVRLTRDPACPAHGKTSPSGD